VVTTPTQKEFTFGSSNRENRDRVQREARAWLSSSEAAALALSCSLTARAVSDRLVR
jgi:hypothetical protein